MSEVASPVPQEILSPQEVTTPSLTNFIDQLPQDPEVATITEIYHQPDKLPLPSPENYSDTLKQILELAREIEPYTSKINPINLLTIDNLNAVKADFLANPTQNPVFTYQKSTTDLKEAFGGDISSVVNHLKETRRQLLEIKTDRGSVEQIARFVLGEIIRDHLAALDLTEGLATANEAQVKTSLGRIYGQELSPATISSAEQLFDFLKQPSSPEHQPAGLVPENIVTTIDSLPDFPSNAAGVEQLALLREQNPQQAAYYADAAQIKHAFEWSLEQYYQHYDASHEQPLPPEKKYQVIIDPTASSIDVRDKSPFGKTVVVPEHRIVKVDALLKLIEHEIEAHARQGLNGSSDKIGGLGGGSLKINDEVLMEGLALVNEDRLERELFGREPKITERRIYYIFTEQMAAQGKDFVATFREIRPKIAELFLASGKDIEQQSAVIDDEAWLVTYRAFRGHTDTSNPLSFASLKDRAYLEGYLLANQLQKNNISHLNELAVPQLKALRLLARFDVQPSNQDFPHLDLAKRYYSEHLSPALAAA
ncbi:flavohemoglobin expression-modulating QEGLA motif protein [Microgenomates group bacterium]|nr:flavohemoglobin expression-modulating QEGLA motif protein [Microgenomates group bacterium]